MFQIDSQTNKEWIHRLKFHNLSKEDHQYLQKLISAYLYSGEDHMGSNQLVNHYHEVTAVFVETQVSKKEKTDLYFLRSAIEKKMLSSHDPKTSYIKDLQFLAHTWKISFPQNKHEVFDFVKNILIEIYQIPDFLIQNLFWLVKNDWKPIFPPLGYLSRKKFCLEEIELYFFGEKKNLSYEIQVLSNPNRFFSLSSKKHQNYVFLSKKNNFDIFEASLLVHEFQHLLDDMFLFSNPQDNLYLSEKNALQAERIFLLGQENAKRVKYHWLEFNLFYPAIILKKEIYFLLSMYLSEKEKYEDDFSKTCELYGLDPLLVSDSFLEGPPFQNSLYISAATELEPQWSTFFQKGINNKNGECKNIEGT